jgi:glutamyl-tRNA synthetase/nondiscriminating glutamyl-tRNA synthetase
MKKVRFAPSPTGYLHIGGVRTALFNYLFTKNQGGEFILRIEDTDVERSSPEMAEEIIQGLAWLGMKWDGKPYYQSRHFASYKKIAFKLLAKKKAYRCFCTPAEIEKRRKSGSVEIFKYDRKCYNLSEEEIEQNLKENIPFAIRFFIPDGVTRFKDRVHKEMEINNSELDDYVLLKSDGSPTYHLSVVADDSNMGITDVVRGDDHISNTFKQVLLYQALKLQPPKYTHLPLILGEDKKKLSKRHGETSVLEFKHKGYLPEAMITYLAQLSWLPGDDKQIFTMAELIVKFDMQKLSKSSPIFDYNKLLFLNSRAIQQKKSRALYNLLIEDKKFADAFNEFPIEKKVALIELIKPRMKTLPEFKEKFNLYLNKGKPDYPRCEVEKLNISDKNAVKKALGSFIIELASLDSFTGEAVEKALRDCAEKKGMKAAALIHPARFALTSETVSPSIFEVFAFFGKEDSIRRIQNFIDYFH